MIPNQNILQCFENKINKEHIILDGEVYILEQNNNFIFQNDDIDNDILIDILDFKYKLNHNLLKFSY